MDQIVKDILAAPADNTRLAFPSFEKSRPSRDVANPNRYLLILGREKRFTIMIRIVSKIFMVSIFLLFGCATARLSETSIKEIKIDENQLKTIRAVSKIRILVEQKLDSGHSLSLPFKEITKQLLENYCRVTVLSEASKDNDAIIRIVANGKPLGAYYSGREWRWSGAILQGTISFETLGLKIYSVSFSGRADPPSTIYGISSWGVEDAPYGKAFFESGSFLPTMLELIGRVYGIDVGFEAVRGAVKIGTISAITIPTSPRNGPFISLEETVAVEVLSRICKSDIDLCKSVIKHINSMLDYYDNRFRNIQTFVIGEINDPSAIEPLIDIMARSGSGGSPTSKYTAKLLQKLTGNNYGTDWEQWRKWWIQNKDKYRKNR